MDNSQNWLSHLSENVVKGVRGYNLCAYLVALEGWRRGLSLKWYSIGSKESDIKRLGNNHMGKLFSLRSAERIHYFFRSRGDLVTNESVEITRNKEETKKWLINANVPVPQGNRFDSSNSDNEIVEYANSLRYPLVIKPTSGSLGQGVITNIQDEKTFKTSLTYVRSNLGYMDVIVERFIQGEDYRIYVIGDNVVGAIKRIPANVVGDGKNSIENLIKMKNRQRKKNPHLYSRLINIDQEVQDFLAKLNYNLSTVPGKGELIYLKDKGNLSSGADSVDATNEITPIMKQAAIESVKAIPGLTHAGVDVIGNDDSAFIIEINPTAMIGSHLFPMEGQSRDIPAKIIDYYFPETKKDEKVKSTLYFDFNSLLEPLNSGTATDIEVSPAPLGKIYAVKWVFYGNVQGVGYRQWIRKKALELGINGFVENLPTGEVQAVVAATNKQLIPVFKDICLKEHEKAIVHQIVEQEWENPVKVGFEIRKTSKPAQLEENKSLKSELKKVRAELKKANETIKNNELKLEEIKSVLKKTERERELAEVKYIKITGSRTWRYTKPFRKIVGRIR